MATGKTSVGRQLAKKLGRDFFDLDEIIQQQEKMPIVEIFKQKGEPYFRQIEKNLVKEYSSKNNLVVSCGGGAIVDEENLANLKKSGVIICLKADTDTILKRTNANKDRPLLNVDSPKEQINNLLVKREKYYRQADYSIDTTNLTINQVVDKIISIIEKENIK